MDRMTWYEAKEYLCNYNERHGFNRKGNNKYCKMVAVISQDSFDKEYSLEERSYIYTNDNKAFLSNMGGYSIFANSMDGSDFVRLEQYVIDEGNKNGWKVEYCYILSEDD